ncbi:MAG: PH domain-containing protein [Candidatus Micrarchaeota archaeon]
MKVVLSLNPPTRYYRIPVILLLLLVFTILAVLYSLELIRAELALSTAFFFIVLAMVFYAIRVLQCRLTKYELTDRDIIKITGILSRRRTVVPLANMHTITIKRTFFDIIFSTQTLMVDTRGGPNYELVIEHIDDKDAKRILLLVDEQVETSDNAFRSLSHKPIKRM